MPVLVMATALRKWIAEAVEGGLKTSLENCKVNCIPEGGLRIGSCFWHPGGLAIETNKARNLQLIELEICESHIQGLVSDGSTCIRSRFDKDTADVFATLHGKPLSQWCRGGIFHVKSYKLILDTSAIWENRLTLELTDFKLLGSEGSLTFGKPIHCMKQIDNDYLLSRIEDICSNIASTASLASQPHSPAKSQTPGYEDSSRTIAFATQAAFASQVPFEPKSKDYASYENVEQSLFGKRSDLLGLLKNETKKGNMIVHQDVSKDLLSTTSARTSAQNLSVLSETPRGKILSMTSKLESKSNCQPSQPSSSSQSIASSSKGHRSGRSSILEYPASLSGSEKENSQEQTFHRGEITRSQMKPANEEPDATIPNPIAAPPKAPPIPFIDSFLNGPIFKDMKRVPRNYVRMSNIQRNLLEQAESWYSADPNPCTSQAVIPPNVREQLMGFQQRNRDHIAEQQSDTSDSEKEQSNFSSDSDLYEKGDEEIEKVGLISNSHVTLERSEDGESDSESAGSSQDQPVPWSPSPPRKRTTITMKDAALDRSNTCDALESMDLDSSNRAASIVEASSLSQHALHTQTDHQRHLPRANRRLPVQPFSSPVQEDDLELDELRAIGDDVDALGPERNQVPATSQEFPFTSLQNQLSIQVERTPEFHILNQNRLGMHSSNAENSSTRLSKDDTDTNHRNDIVPATYVDQRRSSSMHIASSNSSTQPTGVPNGEPTLSRFRELVEIQDVCTTKDDPANENIQAQQQAFVESQSSQSRQNGDASRFLRQSLSPSGTVVKTASVTPKEDARLFPGHSPLQHLPSKEMHSSRGRSNTEPGFTSFKKRTSSYQAIATRPVVYKRRRVGADDIEHEEAEYKDTKAMAKAARHSFMKSLTVGGVADGMQTRAKEVATKTSRENFTDPIVSSLQNHTNSPDPWLSTSSAVNQMTPELLTLGAHLQGPTSHDTRVQIIADSEQSAVQLSNKNIANPYWSFRSAYPDYTQEAWYFTWTLTYIEYLERRKLFLAPWLWDDFIMVIALDFQEHVRQARATGQSPLKGFEFYNTKVERQRYTKGLVNRTNLQGILLLLNQHDVAKYRSKFIMSPANNESATQSRAEENRGITPLSNANSVDASRVVIQESLVNPTLANADPQLIETSISYQKRRASEEARNNNNQAPYYIAKSPLHNNVASSEHDLPRPHRIVPKKRFFETFSQLPPARPARTPEARSCDHPWLEQMSQGKLPRTRRRLPWPQASNSQLPISSLEPTSKGKVPISLSSPSMGRESQETSLDPQRMSTAGSPCSPILGSDPATCSRSIARDRKMYAQVLSSPSQPASIQDREKRMLLSSPFQAPSLSALRGGPSSAAESRSEDFVEKVRGWQLDMQTPQHLFDQERQTGNKAPPKQSFKTKTKFAEFIAKSFAKRRQSGEFQPRALTPGSSPGKRYCTKPITST